MSNNTKISTAAVDVVAVLDQETGRQVFEKARPLKCSIKETSKVMTHPVEDGSEIADHKVINSKEAEMSLMVAGETFRQTYQEIKTLFEKSTLLTIQTRATIYENMIISDMPHDESAEVFDGIIIGMKLIEVNIVKPEITYAPRASSNASTVSRGKQNNTEQPTGERRQSLLSKAFS